MVFELRHGGLVIGFFLSFILIESALMALAISDQQYEENIHTVGPSIFWTLIWIWYFVRSKRVKGTFIN